MWMSWIKNVCKCFEVCVIVSDRNVNVYAWYWLYCSYCAQAIATRVMWTCGIAIDRWFFVIRQIHNKSAHTYSTQHNTFTAFVHFINTLTCLCFHSIIICLLFLDFDQKISCISLLKLQANTTTRATHEKIKTRRNIIIVYIVYWQKWWIFSVCGVWWQKAIFSFRFDTNGQKKITDFIFFPVFFSVAFLSCVSKYGFATISLSPNHKNRHTFK